MTDGGKKSNMGFTLLEMVIVVGILAFLLSLLAPEYIRHVERGQRSADLTNAEEVARQLQVYITENEVGDREIDEGVSLGYSPVFPPDIAVPKVKYLPGQMYYYRYDPVLRQVQIAIDAANHVPSEAHQVYPDINHPSYK